MATFRLEFPDLHEWLWMRYRQIAFFYSPGIVGALVIAVWLAMSRSAGAGFFAGVAAAWFVTAVLVVRDVRRRCRLLLRHYGQAVTVSIAADALASESVHGSSIIRRSGVVRVHAFPRSFAVEYPTGNATIVPRRHLSEGERAVLESWATGGLAASGK